MMASDELAMREAMVSLRACRDYLRTRQVSVATDYAIGEAVGRVEDALADLRRALDCGREVE